MKRFLLLLIVLVGAVLIVVWVLRQKGEAASSGVASLLPGDTALLIHIPDVEASREAWHRADLYQLYREPAVQDFLRKPKAQLPKKSALSDAWRDFAALRIRDAFLATNSLDALQLVGGFEFRCGEREAREIIERWKTRWIADGAQRSSVVHEKHTIDVCTNPRLSISSVVVGHRFFMATTIEELKALLDCLDGRAKGPRLNTDENFRAAMKQMPGNYAGMLYLQPKSLAQKLVTLRAQNGRSLPAEQQTLIERMGSFSHAMVFEGGKLRDIDFVAMPRLVDAKLTRDTLPAASADTLLYLAAILNVRQQFGDRSAAVSSAANVTMDDWEKAFGDEMSLLVEWPASARMPGAVATLAVRDSARAKKIAGALAATSGWQSATRDGIEFFDAPAAGLLPVMRPVAALSDKRLAFGVDTASVERAIASVANGSGLASTATFRDMSKLVPGPQQLFAWLDLAALYARLDGTLRPLLQISAAFMPDASNRVDVTKLPPVEVVTKHLSPVVTSQSYTDGGYRSESVGPMTLGQTVVLGLGGYAGWMFFGKHADIPGSWRIAPAPVASPSPTP